MLRHQRIGITSIALPRRICSTKAWASPVARCELVEVRDARAAHGEDQVVGAQAALRGRAAVRDRADQHAAAVGCVLELGALEPRVQRRRRGPRRPRRARRSRPSRGAACRRAAARCRPFRRRSAGRWNCAARAASLTGLAVDRRDDVAGLDAGVRRRRASTTCDTSAPCDVVRDPCSARCRASASAR